MKLIIRNDDVSYFTRPKRLDTLFSDVWDSVQVGLAIIPKVFARQNETPSIGLQENDYYWVGENAELTSFIKGKAEDNMVKLWQHGFTHKDYGDKYELERRNKENLKNDLIKGKNHLEVHFDTDINLLVPPHDRLSKEAVKAAEEIGIDVISRNFAPRPREIQFNPRYVSSYLKIMFFAALRGRGRRYNRILNFGGHKEMYNYRIEQLMDKNIDDLIEFHKHGLLCITTHHRSMTPEKKLKLNEIVEKAQKI